MQPARALPSASLAAAGRAHGCWCALWAPAWQRAEAVPAPFAATTPTVLVLQRCPGSRGCWWGDGAAAAEAGVVDVALMGVAVWEAESEGLPPHRRLQRHRIFCSRCRTLSLTHHLGGSWVEGRWGRFGRVRTRAPMWR